MQDVFIFETGPLEIHSGFDQNNPQRFGSPTPLSNFRGQSLSPLSFEREVLQAADAEDVIQRFSGPEHRAIGDRAVGQIPTEIVYDEKGTRLTFGEMIALAGDYFDDYYQMTALSKTPEGRDYLRWARWQAMDMGSPKPQVSSKTTETLVEDEYHRLASNNTTHFLAGGTAWKTYFKWHSQALVSALTSGMESNDNAWRAALSKEAFALHFLTDSFSAGHVRTPRSEMAAWYAKHYSNAMDCLVKKFASFMYEELKKRNRELRYTSIIPVVQLLPRYMTEKNATSKLGKKLKQFSLDDIVGLTLHDYDNENGLDVVSQLNADGKVVPGGHRWKAFGDGKLDSLGMDTKKMIGSAVKASLNELKLVRVAASKHKGRQLSGPDKIRLLKETLGMQPGLGHKVAAAGYVPKEDKGSGSNLPLPGPGVNSTPLDWRWGRLGKEVYKRVDSDIKTTFAKKFFEKANSEDDVKRVLKIIKIGGIKAALLAFATRLQKEGIKVLEEAIGKAR